MTTIERSGIDRYSQELARRIGVATLETRRYRSLRNTMELFLRLSRASPPIHFPSQHFGRYGLFLRKPFIITVHDLVRICFPVSREGVREKVMLKLDALGLKRAEHLIAVSASTKSDLIRYLHVPEERVTVICNGVDGNVFKPVLGHRFEFPFLLYVGSERPRKNLGTLLEAFSLIKKQSHTMPDLKLVKVGIAGRTDEFRKRTLQQVIRLGLETEVIFAGYVSDKDLAGYYSSALALVMPSIYEGFGLPIVEAMACGCPVICADSSSLPEIASEAAVYFAPHDAVELARLIREVASKPALRHEMIQKGRERAGYFSWERAARETLRVYRKVEAELGLITRRKVITVPTSLADPVSAGRQAVQELQRQTPPERASSESRALRRR